MALSLEFLGFFYTAFLYAFNLYLLLFPEIPCLIASGCSSFRSSRPDVFYKKGALRNFTKFTGKHLCQSLFSNKVAGLTPATLLKKRLWQRCFPVNFVKFLRTPLVAASDPCIE